jgi:hypothetical protein
MQILAETGCYVTAEQGGGIDSRVPGAPPAVTARGKPGDPNANGPWQQWQPITNDDGTVSFTCVLGLYLTAELGGGGKLSTDRSENGPWQRFTKVGGLLRCYDGVHYLRVRTDLGTNTVDATGSCQGMTFRLLGARPAPKPQAPLPPFDHNDPGGNVATTLPPELIIPTGYDIDFWRGDFGGVTLPTSQRPEWIPGANSTPYEMVMSFLMHRYVRSTQDNILTANAERDYSHMHLAPPDDRTSSASIAQQVAFFKYVQSWGFFTSYWATGTGDAAAYGNRNWAGIREIIEPFLRALIAAGEPEKSVIIVGEELNGWNRPGPDGLDDIITNICAICNPVGMKVALHFTSNVPAWQPNGMSPTDWWRQWIGKVRFLLWQSDSLNPAGTMAAHFWDARKYLGEAGGDAFRAVAFELRANEQLYGRCTEAGGCLTGYELLCAPNAPGHTYPAVAGFGNGARYPSGAPI